jgi:hypothetical protein
MRCLEGTSVGLRERQASANLTLRQLGGNGSRLIVPECVTPTRVEPAPWRHLSGTQTNPSCCSGIFVDQSAESVASVELVWLAWADEV